MKVTLLCRAREPRFHSLERMMDMVVGALPAHIEARRCELPCTGAGPRAVLANLRYAAGCTDRVVHVAGHAHYAAIPAGRRAVLTVADVRSAFRGRFVRDRIVRWLWFTLPVRRAGLITVISDFTRRELEAIVPFARERIRVIPVPCDPSIRFEPRQESGDRPRILVVGTKPNKNLERIAAALEGVRAILVVIGAPSPSHRAVLGRHGVDCEFHEHLSDEAMRDQYRRADLLCFASTYEGFGMPILEAQAAGRPVVTSSVAAMPEVAGAGACYVDPFDPQGIREGILRVLNDSSYRAGLVEAGLENVRRFTPASVAAAYATAYEEVSR